MSVRENIELYGLSDQEESAKTWIEEVGARQHPRQEDAYMLDGLPFHAPQLAGDHISILSFNTIPLPESLIEAPVDHPESFSDDVLVRWTQDQDLILETTLGQLRGRALQP